MLPFTLNGKTILITGASSGIGKGIAIACAEARAKCILIGRNRDRLLEAQNECVGSGHEVEVVDITNESEVSSLIERLPQLDGVVQSAGIGDNHTPLKFISSRFFDEIVAVNLKAPILFLAKLEKKKLLNKGSSIVFVSSIASFHATPAHSLYCATKGGITAFVKAAALDLAGKKIRVNALAPGMVNTPLIKFGSITEEQQRINESRYPLKRYGEPADIAGAAVYLLSDASCWVTGQQFVLDGGITIGG